MSLVGVVLLAPKEEEKDPEELEQLLKAGSSSDFDNLEEYEENVDDEDLVLGSGYSLGLPSFQRVSSLAQ